MKRLSSVFFVLVLFHLSAAQASRGFEVEIDPLAYFMKGYSLHGAVTFDRSRVDLGVFGLEVPQAVHGNDNYKYSFTGFGLKYDIFGSKLDGVFFGIDGGYVRGRFEHTPTGEVIYRDQFGIGPRIGYRFGADGLYISPWISVSYVFGGKEVKLGGETFQSPPIQIFPTVHIGYRF